MISAEQLNAYQSLGPAAVEAAQHTDISAMEVSNHPNGVHSIALIEYERMLWQSWRAALPLKPLCVPTGSWASAWDRLKPSIWTADFTMTASGTRYRLVFTHDMLYLIPEETP